MHSLNHSACQQLTATTVSQHDALIKTCENALNVGSGPGGMVPRVLVFYTHHRPHLATRDMVFFEKAQAAGWKAEEVLTQTFPVRVQLVRALFEANLVQLCSQCFLRILVKSPFDQLFTDGN